MVSHLALMFIALSMFLLERVEMESRVRLKRIFQGIPANNKFRDSYESFRYYVLLAQGNFIGAIDEDPPWWKKKWFKGTLAPKKHELVCGGSLLTPSIVQTACHCISGWTPKGEGNYTYAWPLNVWEDRIYTYVGSNDMKEMYDMLIPENYIIYQSCRRIEYGFGYNMMDYGYIISKESINKKAPRAAISYVPVYKRENIRQYYYTTLSQEYMCLVIGHGWWEILTHEEGYPYVNQEASEIMRWGWRTIMNPMDCISSLYTPTERREFYFPNYTQDTTWVCLQAFQDDNNYLYNINRGDSGGPVTCNSVYFAINSFATNIGGSEFIISNAWPIAHTYYENAAEFREQFIKFCNDYNYDPNVPVPHPTIPALNPTPPPIDIFPASKCPPGMILHYLMTLSFTIHFTF